jgi:N6-L-threonylcarbamoyladenine synthase
MTAHGEFQVVGRTRDDAAGEAFDKAARTLGLGYPGGPALDREARRGDPSRQHLPVPSLPGLAYSFSGLKTALLYRVRDLGGLDRLGPQTRADLAAAFERSVVESLVRKLDHALEEWPVAEVVVCGGVAANSLLRNRAREVLNDRARLTIPPVALCTDNAAMIAAAGSYASQGGELRADPALGW